MRRAAGVRQDYVGGVPDVDPDPDTASEASDGDSLSSEGEYERDIVSRVYRPATISDHSAYDIQLPASRQRNSRPDSSRAGKPSARVVDYATYTQNEARAELIQATSAADSPSAPVKREVVQHKALFEAAFGGRKAASSASAVPDIDFTKPTAVMDGGARLHYDPTAYGSSAAHEIASSVHLVAAATGSAVPLNRRGIDGDSGSRPSTAASRRPKSAAGHRSAAAAASSIAADDEEDEVRQKRRDADAARRRTEREEGEIERLRVEASAAETTEQREYLELKALLREEALQEMRAAKAAAAAKEAALEAASNPKCKPTQPAAPVAVKTLDDKELAAAAAKEDHERHVRNVARAMAARRAGEPYDESLLRDVPEFDLAAAGALYAATRDVVRVDEEALEEQRHRQFYDAVLALEEVVASAGLARVISKCLERHRVLFQRTKVARESGEFTHDEHVAFREFSEKVQAYLFARVAEAVGVSRGDFDVEDFFTRVFEEDDSGNMGGGGDDDDEGNVDYPLLSNDTWEVLLSMLSFESFVDLMDHYIFTRNNQLQQQPQTGAASASASNSGVGAPRGAPASTSSSAAARAAAAALGGDDDGAAIPSQRQTSVAGVDAFIDEGRPVRRVGSADGSTAMSRQSSSAAVGRDSPPPAHSSKDSSHTPMRSPAPPSAAAASAGLRPAGLLGASGRKAPESVGSASSAVLRPGGVGGSSLNARRTGALPPVAAGAAKTKGVPLVPNASLASKRPAGVPPKNAF